MRTTTFFVLFFCFTFFLSNNHSFSQTAGTVTAGNWYRIASNPGNRANATFTLRDFISGGGHSTLEFRAGISFGYQGGISFTLLNHNYYSTPTFTKVRILENDTYDPQYLEVYVERSGSVNFSVYDNLQSSGWVAESWTAGSIPTGYVAREYNVNKLFVVGDYDERFTIDRGGNTQVAGQIHSTTGGFKFPDGSVQITAGIWTPVEDYGAKGNGTTDDRSAIQQAINSKKHVTLSPNKTYLIKSTLIIGDGQTLHIPASSTLKFDASSTSFAAIQMRTGSTLEGRGKLVSNRFKYKETAWNWTEAKNAIMITGQNVKIDLGYIYGFEYGIHMAGNNQIVCCNVHVGSFYDNVICIFIYPQGDNAYVNQNYFHFDNMAHELKRNPAIWAHSCGVYMDYEPNTNYFSGHIEGYKTGIQLAGAYNRLEGLRLEDCETRIKIIGSKTRKNYLFGEFGEILGLQVPYNGQTPIINGTGKPLHEVLTIFGFDKYTVLNDLTVGGDAVYKSTTWSLSDKKVKEDIESINGALNKILALRGTKYSRSDKGSDLKSTDSVSMEYGLIAQELKEVLPDLVKTHKFDTNDFYVINYDGLIPVIIEAFKEQDTFMEDQQARIDELEKEVKDMAEMMKKANLLTDSLLRYDTDKAALFQNTPNPFSKETEIGYYLPETAGEAYILIMDMNGRFIKRIDITAKGENSIVIKGGTLTPGMYIYTLIAGNKEIGTKRMVLTE